MEKVYMGVAKLASNGEEDDLLLLDGPGVDCYDFLAGQIGEDIEKYGQYLSVRYWIATKPMPAEQLKEAFIKKLLGAGVGEAEYGVHSSEITGYLWTDEEIKVGGHDLLRELKSYEGKFIHLEIKYSKE